jgi:hypothetical protein
MKSVRKRQGKGAIFTISSVLEALFSVGILGIGFWFFLTKIVDIHVATLTADNERHAMNLANVLLSYEGLVYEKDGKLQRGVLDVRKLDSFAYGGRSQQLEPNSSLVKDAFRNYKKITFSYPNTISYITITDLENCTEQEGCKVWVAAAVGPVNFDENFVKKFIDCLVEHLELTSVQAWSRRLEGCGVGAGFGAAIGSIVPGIGTGLGAAIGCGIGLLTSFFDPHDVSTCGVNSIPESVKYFFTSGSFAAAQGLPALIRLPDGTTHAGRIMVGVIEWR